MQTQAFQRSRFIARLDKETQLYLAHSGELLYLPEHTCLHRKGDAFTGIFCLLSGKMKATGVTKEGTEYSLAHIMPGAVFGEIAYLDGGDRTHDTLSINKCELLRLPKHVLDKACQAHSAFYQAIVQLACSHIRQSFCVVDDFLTLSPEQRLAKKLRLMAGIHNKQLVVEINQQDLAAWIGISRQSINKILRKWQKQGWISTSYRKLIILNPNAITTLYSS